MAQPPPGLFDSFTEQGLFWLAGREDDEVAGTLRYDPVSGAAIDLIGVFGALHEAIGRALGAGGPREPAVIHGLTAKGKPVTLLDAHGTHRQLHMPGIALETWSSNILVIGAHLASTATEAIFDKSYFRFEEIETWLEHKPFTTALDTETKALDLRAEKPREVAFAAVEDFAVSTVGSLYTTNEPDTRFAVEVISQMAITPQGPRPLDWHLGRATRLQELASLCTGRYLPLTSLELRIAATGEDGAPSPREVHLYARLIHGDGGRAPAPRHRSPIVTGPELLAFNPRAVALWFEQFEDFRPVLRLFYTITAERFMFVNIGLLLAVQALEVFHRRTGGGGVMADADYARFAEAMIAAMPPDTPEAMRDKIASLYRYANEPSLQQRLRAIVASLTEAFGEKPGGFNSKFIRQLVDTRNYFTHFSEELSGRTLDGEGMHWATRRVVLLLTLLFLQRLGLPAADIKPLLKRHREFAQLWAKPGRPG